MEEVQLRDKCWTCLGIDLGCNICNGSGIVYAWIELEELAERIIGIQERKKELEITPIIPELEDDNEIIEDLYIPPNVNI